MPTTTKTDRDLWADPPVGLLVWSIGQGLRRQSVSEGLRALAATYFDDYTDATDLPQWFWDVVEYADGQLGPLDIPSNNEEDEDDS